VGDVLQSYAPVTIDQLAKIGIRATARVVSFGTQFIPQTTEGKYQIAYATLVTGALDPSSQLVTFVTGADNNRMKYSNPEVDSLIKRVQAAVDPGERKRLSDQVQAILWKDVPAVPSALVKYFFGLRPEIQGWTHPGVLKDNMRWEDLWMRG
jgi:ABC-type transport system substrate-binding protein